MTGIVWSQKAVDTQTEVNRFVDALRRGEGPLDPRNFSNLRVVIPQENIAAGASGECAFAENRFDGLAATDETATMWNIISDTQADAGKIYLAASSGAIGSGEDGWVLIHNRGTGASEAAECLDCARNQIAWPMSVVLANFADGTASAGTAALINGTHSLTAADATIVVDRCIGGTSITDTASGSGNILIHLIPVVNKWTINISHDEGAFNGRSLHSMNAPQTDGLLECLTAYSGTLNTEWATFPAPAAPTISIPSTVTASVTPP